MNLICSEFIVDVFFTTFIETQEVWEGAYWSSF